MPKYYTYIIQGRDGKLYTGITTDLTRRLSEHNSGKGSRFTRARTPFQLVYHEEQRDRSSALRREAAIKKLSRSEKLELISK